MKRTKTSSAWMREHVNDFYVKSAKTQGLRSRAAFKLMEIDERDRLLAPGMLVVDLGAAPGGWSQVAAEKVGGRGKVIALDTLEMQPIAGVDFIRGDLHDNVVLDKLHSKLQGKGADLVICDISPNISGVASHDQARTMELAQLAMEFSLQALKPQGGLLVKVFQGIGFEDFLKAMRGRFKRVISRKPKASRGRSREIYLLGRGLRQCGQG
ncbi:MAG TPA: RlmE family RNA methyltransferase [Burkholderiales bacterium]|nr:RlmE family RNA methyltransferase [Burkholderiales bacterium]